MWAKSKAVGIDFLQSLVRPRPALSFLATLYRLHSYRAIMLLPDNPASQREWDLLRRDLIGGRWSPPVTLRIDFPPPHHEDKRP